MRLFFGFDLPSPVRRETARLALEAARRIPGRYAAADNHHITLAFVGETPPERLDEVQAVLLACLRGVPAPLLTLGPCGFFGRERRAILILRVLSDPGLDPLHGALCAALAGRGLPFDPGSFSPHVTLARNASVTPDALCALRAAPLSFRPADACLFLSARGAIQRSPVSARNSWRPPSARCLCLTPVWM